MKNMKNTLKEKIKKIKLIVSDVDGVLTEGKIYLLGREELKVFWAKDATPIEMAGRTGLRLMLLTGRKSTAIEKRAEELAVPLLYKQDLKVSGKTLSEYAKDNFGVDTTEILYIGDDWSDLFFMKQVGISVAPADASPENKEIADLITKAPGGQGVLREIIEAIMRAQNTWNKQLQVYKDNISP